ncbi:S8 family serine peptidase [Neobacillus niacini]|uniref:S8 family serine peptidase n=1 Tax=Neobacillus niacini TaxID=86668 RepID=UPI003983984A
MKPSKKILSGALATGLLLSASIPFNVFAEKQTVTMDEAVKILSGLSQEERKALEQLEIGPGFSISPDINTKTTELVNVIVEFNQAPAQVEVKKESYKGKKLSLSTAKEKVNASHKDFKNYVNTLKARKSGTMYDSSKITIKHEYKSAFNGVSMTLPGLAVEELLHSGAVKRIWSDIQVQLELPSEETLKVQPKMADSIPQIGVDKLHAENITGKGIKVGVLDTGIDYSHPDLAGAYKGYRAQTGVDPKNVDPSSVKGWDFVNNDADPMETTYKEWKATNNPEFHPATGGAFYTSHGTHVSGTIAAGKNNPVDYAVKGVAPDVDLYAYRVLGPYGSGTTEGVLAGIDKAVQDGMDVINLSLGASINDPLYPTSVAINNAMLSGVVSVVAAGNAGPNEKTLGAPGASAFGITVGASDSAISIPTFSASAGEKTIGSMKLLGKNFSDDLTSFKGQTYPLVDAGLGKPEELTNVSGKIALIERGELTFDVKIQNAKNAGAVGVIIFNNVEGEIPVYLGESIKFIPSFQLSNSDGEYLKGQTALTFNQLTSVKTEGDSLADFSSRGPVNSNYDIKPDLTAPGVSIFSTYPEFVNNPADDVDYSAAYARISGTSMATPHIAGVAALMLQKNPDMDPFAVKTALMNTSDDLKHDYSVFEVGAGRVDAYQAVHSKVSLQVLDKTTHVENGEYVEIDEITGSISFGNHYLDNADIKDSRNIKVTNKGDNEQTYKVEVEYHTARKGVQDGVKNNIQLTVPNTVTVGAGSSTEFNAGIVVPQSAEIGRYEGYIHITNEANSTETYQIPFAIRVTDKGIDFAAPLSPSVTNDTPMHQYLAPGTHITFKFKSPMEYFDLIVKDAKTGKAVGIIGTYDGTNAQPDKEYAIFAGFRGTVYPFTNKKDQPVADYSVKLPEGEYVLEMISTDADGKKYHYESLGIVDNTPPEVNLNIKPGVIEINDSMLTEEDGQRAFWVHGQITDKTIDLLQSKGFPYTQTTNTAGYYEHGSPFFSGTLRLDDQGTTKFGVLPEEYSPNPYQLRIFPWDLGTAAYSSVSSPRYVFMKEGTEHATLRYDKDSVKLGDEITVTLDLNNVKNFIGGTFELQQLVQGFFEFQGVKVNEKFASLAEDNGVAITLDEPITTKASAKVGAALSGENFEGLDGDMPFLDVTYKVVDDKSYSKGMFFGLTSLSYKKANETAVTTIPGYSLNTFNVIPKHSVVTGSIKPEAFLVPGQSYIQNIYDMTKLKAKVYAKDADGSIYPGSILSKTGKFEIVVPVSSKAHSIYVELPGHTIEYKNQMLSMPAAGEYFGTYQSINPSISFAGDVTGDQVIDIRDVKDAVENYGKQNPENENLDINQDGVVNETDVRWIEKNFLTVGPKAGNGNKPKETIGKKGLADFLKMIGLEPKGK